MKWAHLHFSRFTFFSVFVCFFFTLLFTSNVSAVSDYSVTIDDSNYRNFSFSCGSDCSSYHYMLVSDISATGGFSYAIAPYSSNTFARLTIYYNVDLNNNLDFLLFSFDNADQFAVAQVSWATGTSFKLTFSENNPFGSTPSGSLNVSENGTYNVSDYAQVVVDVPPEVVPGDYHDDLSSINSSIIVCGAIVLVIYFFYCIYRMIIKNTGVS